MSFVPVRKVLGDLHDAVARDDAAAKQQGIFAGEIRRDVGFQVHRGVHDELSFFVVRRKLVDFPTQHIVKCGKQIEGLLVKSSRIRLEKLAAADFLRVEGFGAALLSSCTGACRRRRL